MARHEKRSFGELTVVGRGSHFGVNVLVRDGNEDVLVGSCLTADIPSGKAGFAKGCLLFVTDAASGSHVVYSNNGTTESCAFEPILSIFETVTLTISDTNTYAESTNTYAGYTIIGYYPAGTTGDADVTVASVQITTGNKVRVTLVAAPGAGKSATFNVVLVAP